MIKLVYKIFPVLIIKISQQFMDKIPGIAKNTNGFTGLGLISLIVNPTPDTIAHELEHSKQFIRWTPILFWLFYSTNMFNKRFDWEVQAYAIQLKYSVEILKYDYQINLKLFAGYLANNYDLSDHLDTAMIAIMNEYNRIKL